MRYLMVYTENGINKCVNERADKHKSAFRRLLMHMHISFVLQIHILQFIWGIKFKNIWGKIHLWDDLS